MREHVREMLGWRLHAVPPPDYHRGLADLALGDPADLVLVEPGGDALRPAQHALLSHSETLPRGQGRRSVLRAAVPAGTDRTGIRGSCRPPSDRRDRARSRDDGRAGSRCPAARRRTPARSEERRVGEERRWRWWSNQE